MSRWFALLWVGPTLSRFYLFAVILPFFWAVRVYLEGWKNSSVGKGVYFASLVTQLHAPEPI